MPGISRYAELTITELQQLDPRKTICLISISPLEVHGPHLPLGTDVFVGERLQQEYCKALRERYPEYHLLILPPVFAGCDPLPLKGSIAIRAKTLERLLFDYVRGLSEQGFRFLIVCDNHGGPSHQIAMEVVARKAWKRYQFVFINPFNVIYRKMVQHDKDFLRLINLFPGECGDDADCHAGTNETSLMLATNPALVKDHQNIPSSAIKEKTGLAAAVERLGNIMSKLGLVKVKADLDHLANLLAWTNDINKRSYLGSPSKAAAEAGERMIKGHVAVAMDLIDKAISGSKPCTEPMLWWLRVFRR